LFRITRLTEKIRNLFTKTNVSFRLNWVCNCIKSIIDRICWISEI